LRRIVFFLLVFNTIVQAQESKTFYFDFAQESLNEASYNALNDWITSHKNAEILKIEGYCDFVDTNLFNKKLANARVQSTLKILKARGVSISQNITINNVGEDFKQSKKQAENRKVIIEYILKSEPLIEIPIIVEEIQIEESLTEKIEKERISLIDKFDRALVGDKITLYNIHFQFNSEVIIPEAVDILEQLLLIMELNPCLEIKIIGHMCCNPDPNDNKLSYRRADKIYNYLKSNGVQQKRLSYRGMGSTEAIYALPERNEEERVANRRVEIEILKK